MLGGVAGYSTARWWPTRRHFDRIRSLAPVAQLDRVPGYEPGGRGFKSCRARQLRLNGLGDRDLARFSFGLGDFWGTFLPNERRQRLVEAVSLIGDQFQGVADLHDLSHRVVRRHTATVVPQDVRNRFFLDASFPQPHSYRMPQVMHVQVA